MREFKTTRSHKAIYDRIASSASRTPEETWLLAEILERCASKEDGKPAPGIFEAAHGAESLKRFAASLSPKDPDRDRRIAAFERLNADRCAGFAQVKATRAEIAQLRATAAAAGDPKARLAALSQEIVGAMAGKQYDERNLSDAHLGALKEIMVSGDPDAIQRAAGMMQMTFSNFSLRAGPEEAELDQQVFANAWTLIACDLGALCGPEGDYLATMCAHHAHCDAGSVRDYMSFYMNSPYRSQLLNQYYEGARAASTGDWSYFPVFRGPAASQARYFYPKPEPGK
jgi:hypothetical protein